MLDIILSNTDDEISAGFEVDKNTLHMLVIKYSYKSYLNHNVHKYNQLDFFRPYKALCHQIAEILLEINPQYTYSKSLATTLLLMSRNLYFFMNNLPSLADFAETKNIDLAKDFLKQMILASVGIREDNFSTIHPN